MAQGRFHPRSRVVGGHGMTDASGCMQPPGVAGERQPEPGPLHPIRQTEQARVPILSELPMAIDRPPLVRRQPHRGIPLAHDRIPAGTARALSASFLMMFGLAAASPAQAQITGYVLNEEGDPVAGAAVEAWAADRKIGGRLADEDGWFLFPAVLTGQIRALYAGQLGYHPEVVQIEEDVDSYEIRLTREPIPLPELVVDAQRDRCAGGEDRGARRLWEHAAARYSQGLDTLGVATYLASVESILPEGEVGTVQASGEAVAQRGSSSLLRFSWRRRIEREGYAYQIRRSTPEQSYTSWVYPPLEADFAPHFAGEFFGDRHRFHFDRSGETDDDGSVTLVFCARDDDHPSMEGTLVISPDTTIAVAQWLFRTPEPVEHAGGRAVFGPLADDPEDSYLLPIEGVFWRRSPPDSYWQRYQKFEQWMVAQGDSVPFLPKRPGD